MKRFLLIFSAMIITLSGCCVKESASFECVADSYEPIVVPAFYLDMAIPQEAILSDSCNDGCCAVFTHSDYEIYQEIFAAESLDGACVHLTGRTSSQLRAIRMQDFPVPEYRFAYQTAGEGMTLSCTGKLFYDGQFCYAVSIFSPLKTQSMYHEIFSEILSLTELKAV